MSRKTGPCEEAAGQSQGSFVFAQHHSICTPSLAFSQLISLPSVHPFDAGIRRRRGARSLGRNDAELSVGCHGPVRPPLLTALPAVPRRLAVSFPVRNKAGGLPVSLWDSYRKHVSKKERKIHIFWNEIPKVTETSNKKRHEPKVMPSPQNNIIQCSAPGSGPLPSFR